MILASFHTINKVAKLLLTPVLLLLVLLACINPGSTEAKPPVIPPAGAQATTLPNGVAAGDVTTDTAVLWARSSTTGVITFAYGALVDIPADALLVVITRSVSEALRPITITATELRPNTVYAYRATNALGDFADGRLRTAALPDQQYGLRFGISGDQRGDLRPYPALRNAITPSLDFFVLLGDTIYADFPSPTLPISRANTLADFRLKYNEVYSSHLGLNVLADLQASTALLATIDDHEILNDFAGGAAVTSDRRFPESSGRINDTARYENGMQAFQEFHPLRTLFYGDVGDERLNHERKLYRYQTYGRDAALMLLDNRSFRDPPIRRVDLTNLQDIQRFLTEAFTPGRTMLGHQQLADLQRDLLAAQTQGITWKFILVAEPMQNLGPAGGHDRFEGYAAERSAILQWIHQQHINNVVFVAADIHGTLVNNLTYQDGAGQPQILTDAFEITTGAVAFNPPMGPTAIRQASDLGVLTPLAETFYNNLPVHNDGDDTLNDKDDFVKTFVNQQLQPLGYDPIGLAGSPINARLVQGDYLAAHSFGWSEFAIDRATQVLTVTTWGIATYSAAEMTTNPSAIITRTPAIVSQFVVMPTIPAAEYLYLSLLQRK